MLPYYESIKDRAWNFDSGGMERSRSEKTNRKKHRAVEEQDMGKPERDKHFVNIKIV